MRDTAPPNPDPRDPDATLRSGEPGEPGAPGATHPIPPDPIGPYHLLEVIGEGGFGVVWLAERREPMVQRVAIKIIKPGMDSAAVVARFEQERQALAVMDHPNVAKVYDGGVTTRGLPYFVMEHVRGEPITAFCDRHRYTIRQRLELFESVCEAVQHAHMKGIIHRDIKPSNILVMITDGRAMPKVIDFGVAKAVSHTLTEKTIFTETGQLIGTPEYMSPEQAEMGALDIDTRSDVYSLGVVLYELVSGVLPFEPRTLRAKGFDEIRRIIREQEAPRPSTRLTSIDDQAGTRIAHARQEGRARIASDLKRELEWIPLRALRKDRARRYPSAEALSADVRRYLEGRPLEAARESRWYLARKFMRRNRGTVLAVGAIAAVLVLASIAVMMFALETRRQATEAARQAAIAQGNADEAQRQADMKLDAAAFAECASYDAEERRVTIFKTLTPAILRHLRRLPAIEAVVVDHSAPDIDNTIRVLADPATGLAALTWLSLADTATTDAGVKELARADTGLKALTRLNLSGTKITDACVKDLARAETGLRQLTVLNLKYTEVSDAGVKEIARAGTGLRDLQQLTITNEQWTDKLLSYVARTDTGLQALTTLDLSDSHVSDDGVRELARPETGLRALTLLDLDHTEVTGATVKELARADTGLKALRQFTIPTHVWTNELVRFIARPDTGLRALTKLDLSFTGVTDAGVKELARADTGLSALAALNLSHTSVSDEGVKELARANTGLKALSVLALGSTRVTDASLKELARPGTGIAALTHLDLSWTRVTDAGVSELFREDTGLKALSTLDLRMTSLTDVDRAALRKRRPGISILP